MTGPIKILEKLLRKTRPGTKLVEFLQAKVSAGVVISAYLIFSIPTGILYVHERNDRASERREEEVERLDRAWVEDVQDWDAAVVTYQICASNVNARNEAREQTLDEYQFYSNELPQIGHLFEELTRRLDIRLPKRDLDSCVKPGPRPTMPQEVRELRTEREQNGD